MLLASTLQFQFAMVPCLPETKLPHASQPHAQACNFVFSLKNNRFHVSSIFFFASFVILVLSNTHARTHLHGSLSSYGDMVSYNPSQGQAQDLE